MIIRLEIYFAPQAVREKLAGAKRLPLNLRKKGTRAQRRKDSLAPFLKIVSPGLAKKRTHFPQRKFAVRA